MFFIYIQELLYPNHTREKKNLQVSQMLEMRKLISSAISSINNYQARAQSTRARRACALRALGLLLADGAPTVGRGRIF